MTYNNKPKGYFDNLLAIDCETTGINFNTDFPPSYGHQAISWGIIVANAQTLKPIEELYVEIKWNKESIAAKKADPIFSTVASDIHGLSFKYLEKNGISENDAVVLIASLILKYWGPTTMIKTLGHNVQFDIAFLYSMFKRYDIDLRIGGRHYDSNSVGFITTGAYTSDALFDTMGFDTRKAHNALEDARMSLESCRRIRVLWNSKVGLKAYN